MTERMWLLLPLQEEAAEARRGRSQLPRTIAGPKGIQHVLLQEDVFYHRSSQVGGKSQPPSLFPIFSHHPLVRGA